TRPLACALPRRAYRTDSERLAVTVEHVPPIPLGPALLKKCLEGESEPEGEHARLTPLRSRVFEPNRSTLHVHRCPCEQPPLVSTPARRSQVLHEFPHVAG